MVVNTAGSHTSSKTHRIRSRTAGLNRLKSSSGQTRDLLWIKVILNCPLTPRPSFTKHQIQSFIKSKKENVAKPQKVEAVSLIQEAAGDVTR